MNKIVMVLALLLVVGGGLYFYKTGQSMPEKKESKSFSINEVANHNSESDCWMVVKDKVYDATSFVVNHPGGPAILKGCGMDATKLFEERPTNNKGPHPDKAREQLAKLYIGELDK